MTTETLTLIFTLIIGIPNLIYFFKLNKTKIVFYEKKIINLEDDLLKNFDDLSIKYKGIEVKDNIYFINGFLVCQGNKDINNKHNTIEIEIPKKSKWVDFKIIPYTRGMEITTSIDSNFLGLNFGLFKTGEFIEFESIIEVNEDVDINKIFNFVHRIPNISKIKKLFVNDLVSIVKLLITSIVILTIPIFITYNYNSITPYEIRVINSETNNRLEGFYSQQIVQLRKQISEQESGISFLFKRKTKNYNIYLIDMYGNKTDKMISIYFRLKPWDTTSFVFSIFSFILFIISMFGVIGSIAQLYNNRRYLKLIE